MKFKRINKQFVKGTDNENWGKDWSPDHRVFITGGKGFRVDNTTGATFCVGDYAAYQKWLAVLSVKPAVALQNTQISVTAYRDIDKPFPCAFVTDNSCSFCGHLIAGKRQGSKFCSNRCRQEHYRQHKETNSILQEVELSR